jgi:hypothetical protein
MKDKVIKVIKTAEGKTEAKVVPCKIADLAIFYGWSYKTIRKKIRVMENEIGKMKGHYLTIRQVTAILRELGIPASVEIE